MRAWSNGMTVAFQAISAGPTPAARTKTKIRLEADFCSLEAEKPEPT